MFRLTREVRFAINHLPDEQLSQYPTNGYSGYPTLTGWGQYLALQVTLQGELQADSNYLRNIKEIDDAVRSEVVGHLYRLSELRRRGVLAHQQPDISEIFFLLSARFPERLLHSITLCLTPFLSLTQIGSELPMHARLSQKFEFSASHRLHNPNLTEEENRRIYGKCNNANGHGHNYEVQVTLRGKPTANGLLVDIPAFEQIVQQYAIEKLDHKNLNIEVPEFAEVIPSVENIARVIFQMLKNRITGIGADLTSVTVWETPKTWCEYSE